MREILTAAKEALTRLDNTAVGNHLKTGDVRRLSAKLFREIKSKPAADIFRNLLKNKEIMPRVSYRYAMEKLDAEKKAALMK